MSRTISQDIKINVSPNKIYQALSTKEQFSRFTDADADIDLSPGGSFSLFNGMITGITVEAVEDRRMVQVWRAGNWPEGCFSLVRFDIDGDDSGSTIRLEHSGFPEDNKDHLEAGWYKMYWDPLKKFIE